MLPLGLFRRRTFSVTNLETLAVYAGLSVTIFMVTLMLQNVARLTALQSGLSMMPITIAMFTLSRRFGALADRIGPRPLMTIGPIVNASGLLLFQRVGPNPHYLTDVLPAVVLFGLGLSMTVAPLTATVLSGVESGSAGIASGVNNAVSRVAGLLGTAAIGVLLASQFGSGLDSRLGSEPLSARARQTIAEARTRPLGRVAIAAPSAAERARLRTAIAGADADAFHAAMLAAACLVLLGAGIAGAGLRPLGRSRVLASHCRGGALAPAPEALADEAAQTAA